MCYATCEYRVLYEGYERMKNYVLSIIASAIVCAVAIGLLGGKTASGKIVKLLCGILMAVTVISPLAKISFSNITNFFDTLSADAEYYVSEGKMAGQESINRIIKSQTEAYILDKATRMGLEVTVEVELDAGNHSIPGKVKIIGNVPPYAKTVLCTYIADNLGIAKENQQWT